MATKEFADVIKDLTGISGWALNANTYILIRGRQERCDTDRREKGNVTPEAGNRVKQAETKDGWQPSEAGRGKNGFIPRRPGGKEVLLTS